MSASGLLEMILQLLDANMKPESSSNEAERCLNSKKDHVASFMAA